MSPTGAAAARQKRLLAGVLAELTEVGAPFTAPGRPSRTDATGWSFGYSPDIDRTSLAWATAYRMLRDHQPDAPWFSLMLSADALLRELRVPGLATLHRDLAGAPVDYRYTRCPYCDGDSLDPTRPTCEDRGRTRDTEAHEYICPVCQGAAFQPEYFGSAQIEQADRLLAEALASGAVCRRPWRIRRQKA
jgi:hypothetical protein